MERSSIFPDVAVVTGAGRGLGKAVAVRLAELNIPVLCISKSKKAADTCAEIQGAGGKAESILVDLGDLSAVQSRVSEWAAMHRSKRLAVILAAGTLGLRGGIIDGNLSDWSVSYRVNVLGNLAVIKALLPLMIQERFGRIITIAGGGAAYAYPLFSGYALAKTALVRATENLDSELRGKGDFLTVCLAPGAMETEMLRQVRAAGAEIQTTVPMEEPVKFIEAFVTASSCTFSGRFVHVRDDWKAQLNSSAGLARPDLWLLRRIENR